jgi:radical SAM superfamily enzyme YgiQ (UPF0313 family)
MNNRRYRFRIIVPLFSRGNVYSFANAKTTSIGPLCVGASANKLEAWDVEVIDENNLHGRFVPRGKEGYLDHARLQEERPADVVGFYGSISSGIPRLFELARMYKGWGVKTVTGGKHVENLPEEALHNGIDVVVFKEGEFTIKELLLAWQEGRELNHIAGIAFLRNNLLHKTKKRPLIEDFSALPLPDFNLLRYAKIKYYPINRIRGCNSRCEFCAVRERARCNTPAAMMEQVKHLVETRKARTFFEASDHFAANRKDAIEFCRLFSEYQKKIKKRLVMNVQLRISDARHLDLLKAMKEAGVSTVIVGYESPIDEELKSMRKGYSSKDLVKWSKTFHQFGFFIHGMFIFGYPKKNQDNISLPLEEKVKRFKQFIRKAKLDTVQIMLTIPLPGTELRDRLEREGRLYPLKEIGWKYYDGQYPLFEPDDGISSIEMQKSVRKILKGFYTIGNLWNIAKNILLHFPVIVATSSLTILIGEVKYISAAFRIWYRRYFRNYLLRFGGYIVLKNWMKKLKKENFIQKLKLAQFYIKNKREKQEALKNSKF